MNDLHLAKIVTIDVSMVTVRTPCSENFSLYGAKNTRFVVTFSWLVATFLSLF